MGFVVDAFIIDIIRVNLVQGNACLLQQVVMKLADELLLLLRVSERRAVLHSVSYNLHHCVLNDTHAESH